MCELEGQEKKIVVTKHVLMNLAWWEYKFTGHWG